jgi:hypothetical protein
MGVQSSKGKEWIRIPSIIYASTLLTVVLVILGEEIAGTHATPHLPVVLLANLPSLLFPIYIIYRMWRYPEPFTMPYQAIEAPISQSFHEHTGA